MFLKGYRNLYKTAKESNIMNFKEFYESKTTRMVVLAAGIFISSYFISNALLGIAEYNSRARTAEAQADKARTDLAARDLECIFYQLKDDETIDNPPKREFRRFMKMR